MHKSSYAVFRIISPYPGEFMSLKSSEKITIKTYTLIDHFKITDVEMQLNDEHFLNLQDNFCFSGFLNFLLIDPTAGWLLLETVTSLSFPPHGH